MSTQTSTQHRPLMPAYLRQAQAELSQAISTAVAAGNYQLANQLGNEHLATELQYRR